jgi:hypothetical protein
MSAQVCCRRLYRQCPHTCTSGHQPWLQQCQVHFWRQRRQRRPRPRPCPCFCRSGTEPRGGQTTVTGTFYVSLLLCMCHVSRVFKRHESLLQLLLHDSLAGLRPTAAAAFCGGRLLYDAAGGAAHALPPAVGARTRGGFDRH